ncbi:stage II sporulation protein M [Schlesneria paludicola]|uniref:stage II sporulation protein M n=1 Tax=Schlesneria paludicola TaxID=360056 RepID=UPI000299D8BF|nr:stage II sporulation protein M [Schlesneria paludicola]
MKAAEIITARTPEWKELEADIRWLSRGRRARDPIRVAQFAKRYRAACADLSLAMSMRFPISTIEYLHQLVGNAHTQLYRAETFRLKRWARRFVADIPARILRDPCTWISFILFWGLFLGAMLASYASDDFANAIAGEQSLQDVEMMYSHPMETVAFDSSRAGMTGFYLFNNAGIGLRCFASGIFLGIGSLVTLAFNAVLLGTIFGHMNRSASAENFNTFVTAHGPFELTAVVLSAAAGLRLGWAIIDTQGQSRRESLRKASPVALEVAGVATVLFLLAAYIEGFISPSTLPYEYKAAVAIISTLVLAAYVFGLGFLHSRSQP